MKANNQCFSKDSIQEYLRSKSTISPQSSASTSSFKKTWKVCHGMTAKYSNCVVHLIAGGIKSLQSCPNSSNVWQIFGLATLTSSQTQAKFAGPEKKEYILVVLHPDVYQTFVWQIVGFDGLGSECLASCQLCHYFLQLVNRSFKSSKKDSLLLKYW